MLSADVASSQVDSAGMYEKNCQHIDALTSISSVISEALYYFYINVTLTLRLLCS